MQRLIQEADKELTRQNLSEGAKKLPFGINIIKGKLDRFKTVLKVLGVDYIE